MHRKLGGNRHAVVYYAWDSHALSAESKCTSVLKISNVFLDNLAGNKNLYNNHQSISNH